MTTIKAGTTYILLFSCDIDADLIDTAIITFDGIHKKISKEYPTEVSLANNHFSVPLTQQDTLALYSGDKAVKVEAQINLTDKSVIKSDVVEILISKTIATEVIDGNTPSATTKSITFSFEGQVIVAKVEGAVTPEEIAAAVEEYLKKHPIYVPTKTSELTNDSGFITEDYHDASKQDSITDLETIRSGAELGATALQSVPSEYAKMTEVEAKGYQTETQVNALIQSAIEEAIDGEY